MDGGGRRCRISPAIARLQGVEWWFGLDWGEQVIRDEASPVNAEISSVVLPRCGWMSMPVPFEAVCSSYGEPITASLYCLEHLAFDTVRLQVVEQRGRDLHLVGFLADVIEEAAYDEAVEVTIDSWCSFDRIELHLGEEPDPDAAMARLERVTDASGLELVGTGRPLGQPTLYSSWTAKPVSPPE